MFSLYVLTQQILIIARLFADLVTLAKVPGFNVAKVFKMVEFIAFMVLRILAIFVIVMGIVTLTVLRAIWNFK